MSCARGCCESQSEHYRSIRLSATCRPTSKGDTVRALERDADFARDNAAYRRLRKEGTQPPDVDGSAYLEATCVDPIEIERGFPMTPYERDVNKEVREVAMAGE